MDTTNKVRIVCERYCVSVFYCIVVNIMCCLLTYVIHALACLLCLPMLCFNIIRKTKLTVKKSVVEWRENFEMTVKLGVFNV